MLDSTLWAAAPAIPLSSLLCSEPLLDLVLWSAGRKPLLTTLQPAEPQSSDPPPPPKQLRVPLLKVLGRLTGYTAGVFVPMALVIDDVIREAGFDPANLPASWDRAARSSGGSGAGIDRNITFAFRYGYRDCTPALTMKGPRVGFWGLTAHGLALVEGMLPRALPKPATLQEPLLQILGRLSAHTAGIALDQNQIFRGVMTAIGADPDHLPEGWEDKGSNRQIKALDRVRSAFKALSLIPVPLVAQPARCQWALTAEGEKVARKLNGEPARVLPAPPAPKPKKRTTPNLTAIWLGEHLTPQRGQRESALYAMMRVALSRRLPVSAGGGLIDDHIQNFMVRAIHRDAFRKVLEDGQTIPYSKVVAYAVNSGRSDARDMGTEPVCRTFYGAKTEKERREMSPEDHAFGDSQPVVWDSDGNFVPPEDAVSIDETASDFDLVWSQIENVVQDHKPQAWERYTNILSMKARGFSTQEIADAEGVSRNRAASMLAEARRCVRESYHAGDLAGFGLGC